MTKELKFSADFLNEPAYEFLKTDEHLGKNIILLGYGGSHAYGTNIPTSDVDVRGVTSNTVDCILGVDSFDQREDHPTDTVVYSLNKAISLFSACNPNAIEILGLRKQDYFLITPIGQELIDNKQMFLSKRVVHAFGGYATAQLRRLQNALAHDAYPQAEKNKHIVGSIENAMATFNDRYNEKFNIKVHCNDKELLVDMNLKDYPLLDSYNMFSEMRSIMREYEKLNHRNTKKDDAHLNKHAMHLIRLLVTGEEILRTGEINTYREKEHDLLMDIRNGKYQLDDHTFHSSFFEMLDEYEKKFRYVADNTFLPDKPNMKNIKAFLKEANLKVILQEEMDKPKKFQNKKPKAVTMTKERQSL